MAESVFKTLGPNRYDNMIVKGMLEYKLKPWEIIVEINTKITPTLDAKQNFKSLGEFREWIRYTSLSRKAVFDVLHNKLPIGWNISRWGGFGYSYDHSPDQLTYDNTSDFNMTIHVEAPEKQDWRELKGDFNIITDTISSLLNFKTNDYVKFKDKI